MRFDVRNNRLRLQAPTLSEAMERYLAEISPKRKGRCTDKTLIKAWNSTRLSNRNISTITQSDLAFYRDKWLKTLAPATVVRRLSLVSHLYTVAIKDWGLTYLNDPSKMLRRPIVVNARNRRVITDITVAKKDVERSEVDWLKKNTRSKFLPTIIDFALETAMRRGEICQMRREHINFKEGFVYIPNPKNSKPRKIPLSPWARYVLIEYLTENNTRGRIFNVSEGVVTRSFNRAVQRCRDKYEELCEEGGEYPRPDVFTDLRFHDLRHEAISRLAAIYEMHELAAISGHSDTRMLLRYYHPSISHLTNKLVVSEMGQSQFSKINDALLEKL